MLIAFICTMTFLPAAITLFSRAREPAEVGFVWAAPLDPLDPRQSPLAARGVHRAGRAGAGRRAAADLRFRPAGHQKPQHRGDAYAARPDQQSADQSVHDRYRGAERGAADALAGRLRQLPTVAQVRDIESFVPKDQDKKLAVIDDARVDPGADAVRHAAVRADHAGAGAHGGRRRRWRKSTRRWRNCRKDHPLAEVAADLRALSDAPDAVAMAANQR